MRSCSSLINITSRSEVGGVAVEKRVTRNVASGEHEGTLADKDYDSGLKSNDKGLELTKCTCTIFTFMMLFPLCSSLEITEITQFGAGRTAILMN